MKITPNLDLAVALGSGVGPDPSIRYLLFQTGDMYEVNGGMGDCLGKYATIEEARANAVVWQRGRKSTGTEVFPAYNIDNPLSWVNTDNEIYDTWTGEDVPVIQTTEESCVTG